MDFNQIIGGLKMNQIVPIELTMENFEDYGYVMSKPQLMPNDDNEEIKYWSRTSEFKIDGTTSTGILCANKREMIVKTLERHINTIEAMVALEGDSILCVGKKSVGEDEEIEGIQAFHIKQGDAFYMNEGTWHWAPYPVNSLESKFLVMFASGTEDNDLQVKQLSNEININI